MADYPAKSFTVGAICQARWSADDRYYKARIEQVHGTQFLVNYIDFGNETEWRDITQLQLQ